MLQVCSDFATERNLSFNAEKTQLICFRLHKSVIIDDVAEFRGVHLTFVDSAVHTCPLTLKILRLRLY